MANPITPLTPTEEQTQEAEAAREKFALRCLIGLDQFINVLTDGDPDETISSRAARASEKGRPWGIALSRFLDIFQKDHGAEAQAGDLERAKVILKTEEQSGGLPPKEPQCPTNS